MREEATTFTCAVLSCHYILVICTAIKTKESDDQQQNKEDEEKHGRKEEAQCGGNITKASPIIEDSESSEQGFVGGEVYRNFD